MSGKILIIVFVTAISSMYANMAECQVVEDGLISFWTFDESDMEDGIAEDIVGNNHGTIMGGPEVVDGWIGDALEFDGTDDYVNCGNDESLNLGTEDFTLEAWFKGGEQISSWPCIIEKGNPLCDGCPPGYAIYWYNNSLRFIVDGSDQPGDAESISIDSVPYMNEEWHHIVGTRDKDNMHLYLDGVQVVSGLSNERDVDVDNNLWIGFSTSFLGAIDEVKVYSRALSEDEVLNNYGALSNTFAVEPAAKLTTTWGNIKF